VSRVSNQINQRQRSKENPLVLGTFGDLALRYLTGTLGPVNQVELNGYGGGTYNHWFQINLTRPAWIIVAKGGPRPNYIQTSVYDLNITPINGRAIFQADSITEGRSLATGEIYIPYLDTVMSTQSDLYNTYDRIRLDRGDDRYYPLPEGSYLLCVSSTRNERIDYSVGVVVEFAQAELYLALEDFTLYLQETTIDPSTTVTIASPITVDTIISADPAKPNGFTQTSCEINSGITVTILEGSEWLIGEDSGSDTTPFANDYFLLEFGEGYLETIHDHTLSEWRDAWIAQHHPDHKFPDLFIPLTNRP
jgi:hypothetical protein